MNFGGITTAILAGVFMAAVLHGQSKGYLTAHAAPLPDLETLPQAFPLKANS